MKSLYEMTDNSEKSVWLAAYHQASRLGEIKNTRLNKTGNEKQA